MFVIIVFELFSLSAFDRFVASGRAFGVTATSSWVPPCNPKNMAFVIC